MRGSLLNDDLVGNSVINTFNSVGRDDGVVVVFVVIVSVIVIVIVHLSLNL